MMPSAMHPGSAKVKPDMFEYLDKRCNLYIIAEKFA